MKRCSKCGEEKPLEAFGLQPQCTGGRRGVCRPCENAQRRPARLSRYHAAPLDVRQASVRRQYAKNRAARIAAARTWRAAHRDMVSAANRRNYAANREKMLARKAVDYAVDTGAMTRPTTCERCGAAGCVIDGHHPSYARDQWLVVEWICRSCHRRHHAAERAAQRSQAVA